jgi:hypothetical protein
MLSSVCSSSISAAREESAEAGASALLRVCPIGTALLRVCSTGTALLRVCPTVTIASTSHAGSISGGGDSAVDMGGDCGRRSALACATTDEGFDPRESWTEADETDETAITNEGFDPRFSPRDATPRLQGSHVAGKTLRDDDDEEEDGAGAAAEVEIEVEIEGSPPAPICWRRVVSPSSDVASAVGSASEVLFRPDETDEMGGAAAACALVLRTRCRLAAAL